MAVESSIHERNALSGAAVLVVEDDPAVAGWIARLLARSGCECEVHDTVGRGLAAVGNRAFDVAVLDVQLPDGRGFQVLGALRRHAQPCGVVMMTGDARHNTVTHAIELGVTEFLPKPFRGNQLVAAMERAYETAAAWRRRLAEAPPTAGDNDVRLTEAERLAKQLAQRAGLTDREEETLADMLAGRQYSDIAARFQISPNTVKYHARNVLRKLNLKSRNELVRLLVPAD